MNTITYTRARLIERKSSGICFQCPEPIGARSGIYCEKHHDLQNAANRKRIRLHKEKKTCVGCQSALAERSSRYCENHLADHRQRQMQRKLHAIETGVCLSCSAPAAPYRKCEACRQRDTARLLKLPLELYQAMKAVELLNKEILNYAQK